ncbi:hypothetical protein G6F22_018414 [Rhizopus arrhizus]|nr:hypothetical protein G6F22_018414 [Rhizopus arrhizus]
MAEGVVGGQEDPALAAILHDGGTGAARQGHGVVGIVHGVGGALRVGQVRSARADGHEGLLLGCGHAGHGQAGRRVRAGDNDVDLLFVEPFAHAGRRHVGLVLVVGRDDFDLLAVDRAAGVFDRHADRVQTSLAVDVGIHARHVGDEADADDIVGDTLRMGGRPCKSQARHGQCSSDSVQLHGMTPLPYGVVLPGFRRMTGCFRRPAIR